MQSFKELLENLIKTEYNNMANSGTFVEPCEVEEELTDLFKTSLYKARFNIPSLKVG